jgi:hypothetical protein
MRFFRTIPEAYTQLQPAIDEAFRADYIDTGRCEHILPPNLAPLSDGKCYLALPEWMTDAPGAEGFLGHPAVEEITEAEYQAAQPQEENEP